VAALSCNQRDAYNSFVQRFMVDLTSGGKALIAYFDFFRNTSIERHYTKEQNMALIRKIVDRNKKYVLQVWLDRLAKCQTWQELNETLFNLLISSTRNDYDRNMLCEMIVIDNFKPVLLKMPEFIRACKSIVRALVATKLTKRFPMLLVNLVIEVSTPVLNGHDYHKSNVIRHLMKELVALDSAALGGKQQKVTLTSGLELPDCKEDDIRAHYSLKEVKSNDIIFNKKGIFKVIFENKHVLDEYDLELSKLFYYASFMEYIGSELIGEIEEAQKSQLEKVRDFFNSWINTFIAFSGLVIAIVSLFDHVIL